MSHSWPKVDTQASRFLRLGIRSGGFEDTPKTMRIPGGWIPQERMILAFLAVSEVYPQRGTPPSSRISRSSLSLTT